MHRAHRVRTSILFLLGLTWPASLHAAPDASAPGDTSLAPYFFVEDGDPSVDRLPLESSRIDYAVVGSIADVTVRQVYTNEGERPIHARYVFPASTRAAVHGMTMTLGGRRIEAKIREREQAKQEFARARKAGKTASLLEQQRPNVFSMDVANVMPGDRVEVTLEYTERLPATDRVYELVLPTVVGPRYASASDPDGTTSSEDAFVRSPHLDPEDPSAPALPALTIAGTLSSGLPIREIESPSHAIRVERSSRGLARIELDPTAPAGARDFVLHYRLAGETVQSGLSLYQEGEDGWFALVVEPPQRVEPSLVPPREYVFVLDVSGSMHGFPLDTARELMRELVGSLRPQDRFNLMLFAGGSTLLSPRSLPATTGNLERALDVLDEQVGAGGTELLRALGRALSLSGDAGLSRHFVVVTDGYVSADRRAAELVRRSRGRANVHVFGIGTSVNRYLVESLSRAGMGEPFVVLSPEEARGARQRFLDYVSAPVLTDVTLQAHGFEVMDVEPATIPDVLAERPIVIQGRYRGEPKGELVLTGATGAGPFVRTFAPATVAPRAENEALRHLWARTRIAALSEIAGSRPSDAQRRAIVDLGLEHNLLTRFTSFIAVAEAIRNPTGTGEDVKQPLPLPDGVSRLAVGHRIRAPEPELGVLASVAAVLLWIVGRRRRSPPVATADRRGLAH